MWPISFDHLLDAFCCINTTSVTISQASNVVLNSSFDPRKMTHESLNAVSTRCVLFANGLPVHFSGMHGMAYLRSSRACGERQR